MSDKCWLRDGCPCLSGACSTSQPTDDGCPVYRYFRDMFTKPRVIDVDELETMPRGSIVWYDMRVGESMLDIHQVRFERVDPLYCYHPLLNPAPCILYSTGFDLLQLYGKRFVFWTAKPTDEQRNEVKLDDESI